MMKWPHVWYGVDRVEGPWPCERCQEQSQFALVRQNTNHIFCRNERCGFERIIDKRHQRVVEDDGTHWEYTSDGGKQRVTPR